MLRKLWHRRALCSVRCFKNGFHQTEQNLGHFISHPRPNDLGAAATLIRFRQSRCRIQWVTWSVVFELSGAQARQHGRSSASNACWCTGSVEGAHEVVGWPTMGRSTRLRMTWSRNTPGCPQVGHSLIGSTGSASITVTSPFSVAPVIVVPSFAVRQMVSTMTFPLGCTVGP